MQSPIAGGVRLTVRWPEAFGNPASTAAFQCGDRVRAVVRLMQPEIYHDPGAWSRQDFLLDQGITSTAAVNVEGVDRVGAAGIAGTFLTCHISGMQRATTSRLLALPAAMRRFPRQCG